MVIENCPTVLISLRVFKGSGDSGGGGGGIEPTQKEESKRFLILRGLVRTYAAIRTPSSSSRHGTLEPELPTTFGISVSTAFIARASSSSYYVSLSLSISIERHHWTTTIGSLGAGMGR